MLFNSLDFAIFLPLVFILYWYVFSKTISLQNCLIVISSYIFYGWWDWRFLALIFFSTIVDYTIALKINKSENILLRKRLLWISITVNLGFLGFFKYYNFFLENFISAFSFFGIRPSISSLKIILPVGISFYTFQTLSYTIDVYKKKLEATENFISFAAFVCFFPQLVAGPIERATHLLPQFLKSRKFSYPLAVIGMRQILWGLFKKIVVADNCAEYANMIFDNHHLYSGSTLVIGAFLFAFQIYGDFSGYSDIAIGTSRLFGFNLMQNFNFPYFSRDMAEFWRRWHISLSTWFRDYLYIPLGGSKGSLYIKIRNTFIIFIVSGFWHGANWTFIIWGGLNALYFLPLLLLKKNRKNTDKITLGKNIGSLKVIFQIGFTFILSTFAWIFFRAENVNHALNYIKSILTKSLFHAPEVNVNMVILLLILFNIIEWKGRHNSFAIEKLPFKSNRFIRFTFYYILILMIVWFGGKEQEFIYFQF